MVVAPSYQRHGVGSKLVQAAITHGRERGLLRIFLSTSAYQAGAMRMYEKFGFILEKKVEIRVLVTTVYIHFYGLKLRP